MMENMKLWNSVCETNPGNTKQVSFGRKFTAIDAYSQIKRATEEFGPYGSSWGLSDFTHLFVPNTNMVIGKAIFVFPCGDGGGAFPITSSIFFVSEKGKADDEFAKKLETDMITKALSRLGFNADVFMGKFDDNRYVQQMKEKFEQVSPEPIRQAYVNKAYQRYKEIVDADTDEIDADAIKDIDRQLTNDERIAVTDALGDEKPEGSKRFYRTIVKELISSHKADQELPK